MRDSTYFNLDSEEFSTLRRDVGRGRLGTLESRIANFALGSNGEILSNGKPVLPVEIHHLTAVLGAVTWYTSDGEKRGAFPSAQVVLASIAECAFAGGTAFGALHLSTVKLVLEQCKSAGTGDSILGGLHAIVKLCWESVQNSSARDALALIPSNLVRLYPNQSDLQNGVTHIEVVGDDMYIQDTQAVDGMPESTTGTEPPLILTLNLTLYLPPTLPKPVTFACGNTNNPNHNSI